MTCLAGYKTGAGTMKNSKPTKATILVVDDDDATRDAVKEVLEDAGYLVATAAHGDQALAYGYAGVIPFVVLTVIAHLAASYSIARDKRLAAALG